MTANNQTIKAIVEKSEDGFFVYACDYPVSSTGRTITELQKNLIEAVNSYFRNNNVPNETNDINLNIDLCQFFQHYRAINAKYLAQRIGMNPVLLSQYVQGKKKPSLVQIEKILKGIHIIGKELSEINLHLMRNNIQGITSELTIS